MGSPSIAVSLNSYDKDMDFSFPAKFIRKLVSAVIDQEIEKTTLLNINIPPLSPHEIKGIRISKLGIRNYDNLFEERRDPRGNTYYWLGGGVLKEEQHEDSDVTAVEKGYISITPIHMDLTDYRLIEKYQNISAAYLDSLIRSD
jgi:5'-nucleotidase